MVRILIVPVDSTFEIVLDTLAQLPDKGYEAKVTEVKIVQLQQDLEKDLASDDHDDEPIVIFGTSNPGTMDVITGAIAVLKDNPKTRNVLYLVLISNDIFEAIDSPEMSYVPQADLDCVRRRLKNNPTPS